ncbi:2-dehydropantoate 2-reductase [Decorospora gaudefroyi]|uniref:2-dehydropantoate 2-reductase n=1 Tax=Decorospora gaudefroyi TaxID=184978 RepID=A0A6A5K651_9PLEO|nr:2-dehydropantoate 2-reductase [Decorospora gaudefroyi]
MIDDKKTVLIVGGGAVGAIAAVNLETGGLATVTIVLRSNYNVVQEKGYTIESCDHGKLNGWRPSVVRNTVPNLIEEDIPPYDYVILCTKNIPDIPPTAVDLVAPALPKNSNKTTLLLLQNGLNIERPFLRPHPYVPILSGISMIGSAESSPGHIVQDEGDKLLIGAFPTSNINPAVPERRAEQFVEMYGKARKTDCKYSPDVLHDRWKKLVFNACLNPICAITGLDDGRLRLADGALDGLVRPAMWEIVGAARAVCGVQLADDVVEATINVDPLESYLKPSMQQDLDKGNFIEFENLLGEPLREGRNAGFAMPTLEVLYQLAKAIQWRIKEERGLVEVPKKK